MNFANGKHVAGNAICLEEIFLVVVVVVGDCSNLLLPQNRLVDISPLVNLAFEMRHTDERKEEKEVKKKPST